MKDYRRFGICRMNGRVKLISITSSGRYNETLADVKEGFEVNISEALTACESGNVTEGKRLFQNKPY